MSAPGVRSCHWFFTATLLTACSVPAAAPVAMFRGNAAHTGIAASSGVDDLGAVAWRFTTAGPVRSTPAVTDNTVYVGSTDGRLYALDRAFGSERWSADVGSPIGSSPAVTHGLVVFGSHDGTFHALDAVTGRVRWTFPTGELLPWEWGFEGWDIYTSSAAVADSIVVFGAGDGVIYALEVTTGRPLWRFPTEGRVRSSPAVSDGVVFAGSTDGVLYAVGLEDGRLRWRHETDGAHLVSAALGVDRKSIIASPAVADGMVFVGSRDGYLYALDQATGERHWRIAHDGSWAMSSPSVGGGTLYAGTSDGRFVHAVDVATGAESWRFQAEGYTWSSPTVTESAVFIGDGDGYLRAIDRETGTERWSVAVEGGVYSSPTVAGGFVYIGSDDGSVYAIASDASPVHRAVFWDSALVRRTVFRSHLESRVFFALRGYEVVDARGLERFMQARAADRQRSVVVFAMDDLPSGVAAEPADTTLFVRYLAGGGKVVWLGLPPMLLVWEGGRVTGIDRERPTALLGVDHGVSNFDFYATTPTDVGRVWGLTRGWVSSYAVASAPGMVVLGEDEHERAGAWVKSYGGPVGSGFVSLGSAGKALPDLEAALALAEYGLPGN